MRRALTSGEIALLEKHSQSCRMYLVVDKPTVLLSAQVNMPIATGQTIVNFTNEELDPTTLYRTWEKLSSGDTVKIGTSRGGQQVGTVKLSSAGPAQIVVNSNSIAWANGQHLSVGTKWYARVSALGKTVGGSFNGGARLIPYDNATGDYTKVKAGMTLYLGSTPGGRDLGRVRIKVITSSLITIAMNSDVQWADNAYITIVKAVDLWSIYPRINPYTGKWYKDEGLYTSDVQARPTVWLPPVPIMGPPGVAFLDDGEARLSFIGESSYTLCSNGIKLSSGTSVGDVSCVIGTGWDFDGGTVVSGSASQLGTEASPNIVKWTSAGQRLVSLNVKNDKPSGYEKSTTGYRPVFILNRPGTASGVNEPYVNFNVETMEGDFESGGWTATIRVFGDADANEFPDNAMIVLFAEEYWGGGIYGENPTAPTRQSIGGYPGRENVKLVAWIMEETTHVGFAPDGERYVEFRVQTIDGLLKSIAGYVMSVEDRVHSYGDDADTSCTEWWHVFKLQVNRTIQYVTAFHTTLHNMCDVYIANDNSRVWAWDFGDGSLYRQIDDYAASAIAARLLSTKQSQLFVERDIQTAVSKPNYVVMALDKSKHLREKLELPRPHRGRVRRVDLEGLIWNGSTETPVIARAPSVAPNQDGVDVSLSGYVADSSSEFSQVAGYMLAAKNNPWTGLSFKFQGNFSFLDIAPQGWLTLSLAATDNKRGIVWTSKKLVPRRITMNYDAKSQTMLVDATLDAGAGGSPGITSGYTPPPPVVYNKPSAPINVPGWNNVAFAGTSNGVYRLIAGVRDWYKITPQVEPFDLEEDLIVFEVIIDPHTKTLGIHTDILIVTNQGIFRGHFDLSSQEYEWTKWELTDPPNSWSVDPAPTLADCTIKLLQPDYVNANTFYCTVGYEEPITEPEQSYYYWLLKIVDNSGTLTLTWMPLSYNYPTLTGKVYPNDIRVDTQNGSRIYITGNLSGYCEISYGGYAVVSNSLTSVIRYKLLDSGTYTSGGDLRVAVPWYRSGGARNGNHVMFYGPSLHVSSQKYCGVYSTDGGETLNLLNTGVLTNIVPVFIVPDAITESAYRVFFSDIVFGGSGIASYAKFSTWPNNWATATRTNMPGEITPLPAPYTSFFVSGERAVQHIKNSNVVLASLYNAMFVAEGKVELSSAVCLSINADSRKATFSTFSTGLPLPTSENIFCLALDWGK